MILTYMPNVEVDREWRFKVGDVIRHVEDFEDTSPVEVVKRTLRIRNGVAFPTYTVRTADDQFEDDVLDTEDLELHPDSEVEL